MISCGLSELCITPALGTSIPGQLYERRAAGVKDELYAKAMVLDDGNCAAAFVIIDAVSVETKEVAGIRERVFELTGIPKDNIMVTATHTHTGIPSADVFGSRRDEEYLKWMVRKAADVAVIAYKRRIPVKIGFGQGEERDIAFNRRFVMKDGSIRTNPGINNPFIERAEGSIDPCVTVIRIDDMEDQPFGVVTNYACHLDVTGGEEYSGDYPGELSRTLKKVLGQEIVSIFFTGTCGNINHIDVSGNIDYVTDYYKKMGNILAGEVIKVREKIKYASGLDLSIGHELFPVGVRLPSEESVAKAKKVLVKEDSEEAEICFANEILKLAANSEYSMELEVQAVKIGKYVVLGLPGEIFVEFGLDIKKQSPFEFTVISELANGTHTGYVPTLEAFRGGYEPTLTHDSRLVPQGGYIITSKAIELLTRLNGKQL